MAPMVIVGAGECGTRAAFALREAGWRGEVVLIGDEPGLPYERPPLSKPGADGAIRRVICDAETLRSARIDHRSGLRVAAIERQRRQLRLSDGSALPYERLLLATGARPRRLTCPGADAALSLRTHADAERLFQACGRGANVVVVGAGLIGMELAAVLRMQGAAVTVVEAGPRALGRAVPQAVAARLQARHAQAGVDLRFNAGVSAIAGGRVHLTDGSVRPADVVVAAVGVEPDTTLAQAAGLAVDNGIEVDTRLATADPHIFAAGDCARFFCTRSGQPMRLESWQNARAQGEYAARAMVNPNVQGADAFDAVPWFWSDQFELGLQIAGWPDPQRSLLMRQVDGDATLWFQQADDGSLLAACGLGPGQRVGKDIKLAQMLIARRVPLSVAALADPAVSLKSLLKG